MERQADSSARLERTHYDAVTHDIRFRRLAAGGRLGLATMPQRWGYGMPWWVWDAPSWPGTVTEAYSAIGSDGYFIAVLPVADAVIVHKVDIDTNESPNVSLGEYMMSLGIFLESYCGECK
jgi:hypothetical protein